MNIVFYGGHYWEKGPWFRKQQFASRLAKKGHTILYVESSVSILRKNKNQPNKLFKTQIKKINNNLFIITPSAIFPFPRNYQIRKLYNFKLSCDIQRILKKLKIKDYIFWFNELQFSSIIHRINKLKIFDLADDRPYYSKLANDENEYHLMLKYIEKAFSLSDISVVSAQKIKEKYQKFSKSDIIVIPNGHNISPQNIGTFDKPIEIQKLSSPIIGFVGTLFRFIDEKLLEFIISKRPNYNFVFVGPIENNFPIEKINKFNNVYILGEKPKSAIPNYINSFNVCLNPFKIHEVNDSVSPVKVFEYLALNKYVLSTRMYSLEKEQISKNITFADNYDDFLIKLDNYVNGKFNLIIDQEVIKKYSWDNLFEKLLFQINEKHQYTL